MIYGRDQKEVKPQKVQQRALELTRNSGTGLAVRLSGEGGGREVKEVAIELLAQERTLVILK